MLCFPLGTYLSFRLKTIMPYMRTYCRTCIVAVNLLTIAGAHAQTLNPNPSRVIGQRGLDVNSLAPNLEWKDMTLIHRHLW